jgi:protein-tyrosine phosphatase
LASPALTEESVVRHIPDYSLWLGHAGDARDRNELLRLGVGAVVDLAVEEPPAVAGHEMVYCRFPLLRAAIDLTATLLRQKIPTLVACSSGLSRAPAVAAAALVRLGRPTLQDAIMHLANFGQFDVSSGLLQDVVNVMESGA